jgi:UDP-N-acetylmuramate: L-alanyl-gamma-D-glutamyl-meso-diaminopimelate ligase
MIISNGQDARLESVLEQGCWSRLQQFSMGERSDWRVDLLKSDGSELAFHFEDNLIGQMSWAHCGRHNAMNACAAVTAAVAAGVNPQFAIEALASFKGVKRRMELITQTDDIHVYDDFAHHPTAIRLTLEGLRRNVGNARVLVALEPRSNTMRAGVHIDELGPALMPADRVWLMAGEGIDWDPQEALAPLDGRGRVVTRSDDMLGQMLDTVQPGDHVIFMSNGGFDSAPARFSQSLKDHEHR